MTAAEQELLARALTSDVERSQLGGSSGGGVLGIDKRDIERFVEILIRKRFAAVRHARVARSGESAAALAADFAAYARANRLPISSDPHADEKAFSRWRKARASRAAWFRLAASWREMFAR